MRKGIMIGVMILIVIGYIFMVRGKFETNETSIQEQVTPEQIVEKMPETPEDLILAHNRLMKMSYNSQTKEEDIPELVEAMRKLYSQEFLALNTAEGQEEVLREELLLNGVSKLYLLDSKLEYIKYNEKEDEAEAVVLHQTTKGDQTRTYDLIKEDGIWKIHGWENIQGTREPSAPEEK